MHVYACVNILSHISRVAQPGLLYVLSPVTITARAPRIASVHITPLEPAVSSSGAPTLFPQCLFSASAWHGASRDPRLLLQPGDGRFVPYRFWPRCSGSGGSFAAGL